jgi:hypothetical protein
MFREITTHKVNGLNDQLRLRVMDEPGAGGACHLYRTEYLDQWTWDTHFQEGPLQEVGVNGVSNEALLAMVRDRLECFQAGTYACEENEKALVAVIAAMSWLCRRTKNRLERGVEGTSTV